MESCSFIWRERLPGLFQKSRQMERLLKTLVFRSSEFARGWDCSKHCSKLAGIWEQLGVAHSLQSLLLLWLLSLSTCNAHSWQTGLRTPMRIKVMGKELDKYHCSLDTVEMGAQAWLGAQHVCIRSGWPDLPSSSTSRAPLFSSKKVSLPQVEVWMPCCNSPWCFCTSGHWHDHCWWLLLGCAVSAHDKWKVLSNFHRGKKNK